ncbi:DUF4270 domain-containing protein [Bizionia argentinensis JUB59]|uniref:DUF4270 domain-containing protein n=1 Tax=Bizionia argentinensis JUB59 TaxID=1046627 RepID=G2EH41_9FLAO|nr:DUF4270 domain-containing protein [Bizionia argentinensis]EGV42197.1 DUF4270 domain-containing protein [Bizionia argentinensis JUB59]
MKKTMKLYNSLALVGCLLLTVVACEKDFSSIESEIEGIKNFTTDGKVFSAVMYDQKLEPVQTNALSSNLLGIYNDKIYGKTTASVVIQAIPTIFDFNFGDDPRVESVYLTIPYYSKVDATDTDGNKTYKLDSTYGSNQNIKLSIYQNTYFLRDFDPGSNNVDSQKFYSNSNQTINFDNYLGELLFDEPAFKPSNLGIPVEEINEETGLLEEVRRMTPSLHVELENNNEFWDNLFFFGTANPGSQPQLSNVNNFKNYFRGLYFKAADASTEGNMTMLDFSKGTILINYSSKTGTEDDGNGNPVDIRDDRKITLALSGNRVNIFENSNDVETLINNATSNTDLVDGDNKVFLKGGEGSFAIIDLFTGNMQDDTGNTISTIDYIKSKKGKWLINEASLTVFVDQSEVNNSGQEPERVVLYDLKNNTPIIDYFLDPIANTTNPLLSKTNYANRLKRDDNDKGLYYKFRLTEHINNIILRDSTNLQLGIYVTTNINVTANAGLLNVLDKKVPNGAVLSPRGTVLHGSNPSVPNTKKMKFEIFYTEPNN